MCFLCLYGFQKNNGFVRMCIVIFWGTIDGFHVHDLVRAANSQGVDGIDDYTPVN